MIIALVDDHILLAEGIKRLFLSEAGIDEVRTYNSGNAFLADKSFPKPDILITDLMMPGMNGMKLVEICRDTYSAQMQIVILSSLTDVQTIKQAIRGGANGFLSKDIDFEELIAAIHEVHSGKQYIGKGLRSSLLDTVFTEEQVVFHLSPREKIVLHNLCSGRTIKEISYDLGINIHTTQYYQRNIMRKFKVNRTVDLIVFAMQHGLYIPEVKAPDR